MGLKVDPKHFDFFCWLRQRELSRTQFSLVESTKHNRTVGPLPSFTGATFWYAGGGILYDRTLSHNYG